ncbi:MAG: FG-GAP-like repeat-containing protein [Acidobacteriaceae bacterium]
MGLAPLLLPPAPLRGLFLPPGAPSQPDDDLRLIPHYPAASPLADVLRLVPAGSDNYPTEKYAIEIESQLEEWGRNLTNTRSLARWLRSDIEGCSLQSAREISLRKGHGIDVVRRLFAPTVVSGAEPFLEQIAAWLGPVARIETAEFEIYGIEVLGDTPPEVRTEIRYDIAAVRPDGHRQERVGSWRTEWVRGESDGWKARRWQASEEKVSTLRGAGFHDVTAQAMEGIPAYRDQLCHGVDYWRTVLDGACGIDIYSNTGIAVGDFDGDGWDDFYLCEPAGLPNRLFRNRGDGHCEDVTEKAGVGVLDNTACALFADFRNAGVQDLLVVTGTGPLLFLNKGDGTLSLKRDAFQFARPPQGSFTHAAAADYDGDGRLDVYFCTYMYYLGLDQYHYPIPYYDARNGPPNCLMHNEGGGRFVESTEAAGLNVQNDRYSFAAAWGDSRGNGSPDLFVANDFGTSQLYRNNGNGTFTDASKQANVENVGAGMSCAWSDFDNSGHQSVYVASMWEAAGQRVSEQKQFHEAAPEKIRALYQRHARGNALYRNRGDGSFENVGHAAGVEMGRWSWCSDFLDFDHDGYADLYVANGYISGPDHDDLASFFWRQVVAKSPEDATPSPAYERGWGAINELVRSDHTWHGYARNVLFVNNRDGTFAEISAPAGLDFREDSRAFALTDLDHDGRQEILLRNRNAPQLRILHNAIPEIGSSIAFRLRGQRSNRDAIGASITVMAGNLRQTKYLQAGSGFLAQHSKEIFFGLGTQEAHVHATVRWPSGLTQEFADLPVNHRIELEEGSGTLVSKPFGGAPAAWAHIEQAPLPERLPHNFGTWLLQPLTAPDPTGKLRDMRSQRAGFVVLIFWATTCPPCRDQLRTLEQHRSVLAGANVQVLAMNVDEPAAQDSARLAAAQQGLTFPVAFADRDVAGMYNIIYRYLFDRRRDLGLPTSFLIDPQGQIVRIYDGLVDPQQVVEDVRVVPDTEEARILRAVPFAGKFFQGVPQRNDFTYGVAMFQHGYLEEAEVSFREVLARKPNDPEAYYNLGTLSLRKNDPDQARQYLEQAVKLRPDYPEAWNNLGMIAAQQDQPDQAVRDLQQSLLLRPGYATALLNLGNVYRRRGDFVLAEQSLRQAETAQPDDPEVSYSLGMLYAEQGQMPAAEEYLEKAIALRPDFPQALNNLGVLLVHLQEYARAEEQFRTCIQLVPNFDQSYLNLASLYAMQGQAEQARAELQELLRIQPNNTSAQQALRMLQSPR